MIRNFLKITLRNFLKNKSYVFINLIGLGISMACCIVGYLNWKYYANFDQNHENHEKIYKININKDINGRNVPYGITPLGLGSAFKGQVTGITHSTRYTSNGLILKKDLNVFNRNIGFAEEDFFEMFTFPFKYGNKEAFLDPSKIILSSITANSYFGEDVDPTGEIITIIDEDGNQFPMTVGGVLEPFVRNSSVSFGAITLLENYLKIRKLESNNWKRFVAATFVMTDGSYPEILMNELNTNYVEIQNAARDDFKVDAYSTVQLTDLIKIADTLSYNWLAGGPPKAAFTVPMVMALLMLLIACFNFTNTSIAISSKRLKEIGIRKVMGSDRKQLIFQFMGENLLLSFFSILVALAISGLLVPAYSAMWDFLTIELDLFSDPEIYLFLIGLMAFTSLIAGGYPSIYISAYQPVNILRGSFSLGGTNWFSKILLGMQYMLTIIALIGALAFANNANYQNKLDIGFEKNNILGIRIENTSEYDRFSNLIGQLPEVEQMTGTSEHIGWWDYLRTLKHGEEEVESSMMDFSLDYMDIMNLQMVEGRYFDKDLKDFDRNNSIILNQAIVKEFGWEEPLGKVVQIDDSARLTVIGVMEDFYMYGFFNPVKPTAFRLCDPDDMNFVVAKSNINQIAFRELMEEKWYEVAPNTPFNSEFMDEELAGMEVVNLNIMKMFQFLGLSALILSSIGLYTLVSLSVIRRVKEIGVRKVLGATISQILVLMNRQFFWLLVIFSIIGAALSYLAIDALMGLVFAVYLAADTLTILIPFITLLAIALGVASFRIFKTATQNPVKSLRYE